MQKPSFVLILTVFAVVAHGSLFENTVSNKFGGLKAI